jgi:PTH1 family peptidyl-tRNA hydrolase
MKIIIGLGNPGEKYTTTRHNAGFLALDHFLKDKEVINCASKFEAQICEYHEGGNKMYFIKPQTFMNNSGKAVREFLQFYKVDPKTELLVVHDDKDLAFGTIKTTNDSSGAGHNGVQNIIDELGTQEFNRIRIGVESRESGSPIPTDVFVLQNFSDEELEKFNVEILPEIKLKIDEFLKT